MSGTLGQVVALGIAAGLSPVPIIGIVMMLSSARARTNSLAFLGAWVASILVLGYVAIFVVGASGAGDSQSSGRDGLRIVFGVILLLLAARQWRSRPREGQPAKTPGWLDAVDAISAARSAALALALAVINPKNLILVLSASTAIAAADASSGAELGALVLFTVIASIGVGTPVALYFALGERSAPALARLKQWMTANNAAIMTVILAIIGLALLTQGVGSY